MAASQIRRPDLPADYNSIHICHMHVDEIQFQRDLANAYPAPPGKQSRPFGPNSDVLAIRPLLHVQRCYTKTIYT